MESRRLVPRFQYLCDLQVVNPMTKYALVMMPVALSLEELVPSGRSSSYGVSLIIRTILVTSTLAVALAVPFFGTKNFNL
jgi:vesicular inhibitory amino acid transporter